MARLTEILTDTDAPIELSILCVYLCEFALSIFECVRNTPHCGPKRNDHIAVAAIIAVSRRLLDKQAKKLLATC